jgi:hypothetical protein
MMMGIDDFNKMSIEDQRKYLPEDFDLEGLRADLKKRQNEQSKKRCYVDANGNLCFADDVEMDMINGTGAHARGMVGRNLTAS